MSFAEDERKRREGDDRDASTIAKDILGDPSNVHSFFRILSDPSYVLTARDTKSLMEECQDKFGDPDFFLKTNKLREALQTTVATGSPTFEEDLKEALIIIGKLQASMRRDAVDSFMDTNSYNRDIEWEKEFAENEGKQISDQEAVEEVKERMSEYYNESMALSEGLEDLKGEFRLLAQAINKENDDMELYLTEPDEQRGL